MYVAWIVKLQERVASRICVTFSAPAHRAPHSPLLDIVPIPGWPLWFASAVSLLYCVSSFYLPSCFFLLLFPQQRQLMGSSAQNSSGVRRCGSQAQVPEGSGGRFWRVPQGSDACLCRFRKVPEGSGVCWWRFRRVSEGAGGFQKVPECWRRWQVQRFRKVWGGFRRVKGQAQVLEGFASLWTKQCTCADLKLRKPMHMTLLCMRSCC